VKRISRVVVCFLGLALCVGCSRANEKANKLFVEATQLQRRALYAEATSYAKALELNNAALKNLERIISKYPSSDLAVRLASGQTRFEGFTLDQFKVNQVVLEGKARAEKDPLLCALLASKMIDTLFERTCALNEIADLYLATQEGDKASRIVSEALQVIEVSKERKAGSLLKVLGKCTEAAKRDKAYQIMYQFLGAVEGEKNW